MKNRLPRVTIVRHGETQWSRTGLHTGRTDIPLLEEGERNASAVAPRLAGKSFGLVLASPLQRAWRTCELAGFGQLAKKEVNLMEWDYGDYEGLTTSHIREQRPGWYLFRDGCPNGESAVDVGKRVDQVIDRVRAVDDDALLFAHGHLLRVLAARWLGMPPDRACSFVLATAAVSVLGYEHRLQDPALLMWNDQRHLSRDVV